MEERGKNKTTGIMKEEAEREREKERQGVMITNVSACCGSHTMIPTIHPPTIPR